MTGYQIGVLVLLSFNVMAAYAVYLPLAAGQLNLGIAGFMVIGAYVAAFLTNEGHWPVAGAVIGGGAAAGCVAFAVAVPILRAQGIYLALATFALGQVIAALFLNVDAVGGAAGYPVDVHIDAYAVIGVAISIVALMGFLATTRFALCLTAVKSDPLVADLMGIRVKAIQVSALTLGACLAGIGGGLYAHYFNYVEAQYFGVMLSTFTVLYVLFGGIQTIWGPLVGAALFTIIPEMLRSSAEWRYVLFAGAIIIFMSTRPEGLITSRLVRRLFGWVR